VALIFLGGLVGGAVINLFFPFPISPSTWIRFVGAVPLALGIWLFVGARVAFRRHGTPLMPWSPSTGLVQDGPYRFTRNPIYLAFVTMYLGVSLIFNSVYILFILVIVWTLFDQMQIPREERYLEERFGEEFTRYKARVRRWI
jgi:protein-S-isoprenylcysteine O-methyltransferase Ste14